MAAPYQAFEDKVYLRILEYTVHALNTRKHSPLTLLEVGFPASFSSLCRSVLSVYSSIKDHIVVRSRMSSSTLSNANLVVCDPAKPAFSAIFDLILINFISPFTAESPTIIRHLVHCLKPGGTLCFVGLGECSFYECRFFDHEDVTPPIRNQLFLDTEALDFRGTLKEEWATWTQLDAHGFSHFLRELKKTFLFKANLPKHTDELDMIPHRRSTNLTFHLLYGVYQSPSRYNTDE